MLEECGLIDKEILDYLGACIAQGIACHGEVLAELVDGLLAAVDKVGDALHADEWCLIDLGD